LKIINFIKRAKEIDELIIGKEQIISRLVILEVITVLNIKLKATNEVIEKTHYQMQNYFEIIEDHYFMTKHWKNFLNTMIKTYHSFDCVYMTLMEELGIKKIISFDKHFQNKKEIKTIH
jgi:predicted nucleic acid-binding protein